jgi:hypothetical protein
MIKMIISGNSLDWSSPSVMKRTTAMPRLDQIMLATSLLLLGLPFANCAYLVGIWNETDKYLTEHEVELQWGTNVEAIEWEDTFSFEPFETMVTPKVIEMDTVSTALDILKHDSTKKS